MGWRLTRNRKRKEDSVDLFDGESQMATEREIAFMWLHDLNERVGELEDAAGFAPRMRQLALWSLAGEGGTDG